MDGNSTAIMKRTILKTGDILLIPLSDSQAALGQIVMLDLRREAPLNPLLRVIKGIYEPNDIDLDKIDFTDELFPPVITGVGAAVKTGLWEKIGNKPVENFTYPRFLSTFWNQTTGEAGDWLLIDQYQMLQLGKSVPDDLKSLEFRIVLDPHDVVERILTGKVSWPFGDLIMYNKFTPQLDSTSIADEDSHHQSLE